MAMGSNDSFHHPDGLFLANFNASFYLWLGLVTFLTAFCIISALKTKNGEKGKISPNGLNSQAIPGPPPLPIVGSLFDVDLNDSLKSALDLAKKYGEIMELSNGEHRELYVSSRELAHELCDEKRFCKLVYGALFKLRAAGGDGLFTAQHGNHEWEVAHRVLAPVFGQLKINDMFDEMRDIAGQLCLKWARQGPETDVHVVGDFTRLTLDMIALCAMGYRFNSFYLNQDMHPYVQALSRVLLEADRSSLFPDFVNQLVRRKSQSQMNRDVQCMSDICREIIRKRRAGAPWDGTTDLLHTMLHGSHPGTGEKMSEDSIIHNLNTFLIAGHDTTSGLLSFAFYYLLTNPETLQEARKEVDRILGPNGAPTLKDLGSMTYMDMVLKETLRLQPTVPAFHVKPLKKDDVLKGGAYHVTSDDPICVLLHHVHRDPAVWGDDAEEFRPERMTPEKFSKLPPHSWMPFGNGVRACLGRAFAWQEAMLVMAMLLHMFDMQLSDPTYKLQIRQTLSIKPKNLMIKVSLRHGRNPVDLANIAAPPSSGNMPSRRQQGTQPSKPGFPISILYGSNNGTCEALARQLACDAAVAGFDADTVAEINAATDNMTKARPYIFIAASYNGNPSENAAKFTDWVSRLPPGSLKGVDFCVFGLGHRDWPDTLNRVPTILQEALGRAGARTLVPCGFSDTANGDMFGDLNSWSNELLWQTLQTCYGVEPALGPSSLQVKIDSQKPSGDTARPGFFQAVVANSHPLSHPSVPKKHHLELRLPDDVTYQVGDRLQVLPKNTPRSVHSVLLHFGLDARDVLTVSSVRSSPFPHDKPLPAADLLALYPELNQVASPRQLRQLADAATDPRARDELRRLSQPDVYGTEVAASHLSPVDLLGAVVPRASLPLAAFLGALSPIRPRTYSISSAPSHHPNHASLTISVAGGGGPHRIGLASGYLAGLGAGDHVRAAVFSPPRGAVTTPAPTRPIIMIAAGAGLAPCRAMVQERARTSSVAAPALLLYGCRGAGLDDMYRAELDELERAGAVAVHRAFSRDALGEAVASGGGPRGSYVTDVIRDRAPELVRLWTAGAAVYICSGKKVCDSVSAVLGPILFEVDKRNCETEAESVESWFDAVPKERYVTEVFN